MKLSILIVNYKIDELVRQCIESIKKQETDFEYEVIVHDNSEENIGFGAGNNRAAEKAKGQYLFILNPDTCLEQLDILSQLVTYLDNTQKVGIVAPQLIDKEGRVQWSADKEVTLGRMLIDKPLALIYRYLGSKSTVLKALSLFSCRYRFDKTLTDVDRVSAAAFMVRREIFEQLNGFDETFFMYFEDDVFCLRVKKLGYEIHYCPQVTIRHLVGQSFEKNIKAKEEYYFKSQDYYFKKNRPAWELMALKILRFPYRALKLRGVINRYF